MDGMHDNGPRLIFKGLMILLILIGLAIFASAVISAARGGTPIATMMSFGWGWVWNIIGIIFAIWILSWIFRWAFWGHPHRHYARHWWGDERTIARMRYAGGDITKKEYDEIIRNLNRTKE
ncbi:MAG: hypothetical protein KGH60_04165 [Candidatus Micrarchaeota archaeon]|nr:hypothetical protein [Candidatus Micrarchaeota archaeon]